MYFTGGQCLSRSSLLVGVCPASSHSHLPDWHSKMEKANTLVVWSGMLIINVLVLGILSHEYEPLIYNDFSSPLRLGLPSAAL